MKYLAILACPLLSGCWFVIIPGSVTNAISDGITGDKGNYCAPQGVKVGDTLRFPGGGKGRVTFVSSGGSVRCSEPDKPVRVDVAFDS